MTRGSSAAERQASSPAAAHVAEKYRPDIDGLRAIAVLAVVVYHFANRALPGGYLGVDVFFVISGYLITSIVVYEAAEGRFSFARFYERRIRRIAPALLAMLLGTAAPAIWLLRPFDLAGYGCSAIAALLFAANIFFRFVDGYFDLTAELRPLIHTWSLGVEEQFYIFAPPAVMLLARRPRFLRAAVVAVVIGSLALDVYALATGRDNAAFYYLPFRAWELGLGALIAVAPGALEDMSRRHRDVLALAGLACVAIGLATAGRLGLGLPPGLLPGIGAAMLIAAGRPGSTVASPLLAARPMVRIGLFSYSLYLWHWPILVFTKHWLLRHPEQADLLGPAIIPYALAFAASFAAAALSLRFIERPFRSRAMPLRTVLIVTAAGAAAVLAIGIACAWQGPNPRQIFVSVASPLNGDFHCPPGQQLPTKASVACRSASVSPNEPDRADVVMIGDSHAQAFFPGLSAAAERHGRGAAAIASLGCPPTLGLQPVYCDGLAWRGIAEAEAMKARKVVLAVAWGNYLSGKTLIGPDGKVAPDQNLAALLAGLARTAAALRADGKTVYLVAPIPFPKYDVADETLRAARLSLPLPRAGWIAAGLVAPLRTRVGSWAAAEGVTLVRLDRQLCDDRICRFERGGLPLFADTNHVNAWVARAGAAEFAAALGYRGTRPSVAHAMTR